MGPRKPNDEFDEEEGLIRSWLKRADELLRRSDNGAIRGKKGGTPSEPERGRDPGDDVRR
jgi:hypothetical protein